MIRLLPLLFLFACTTDQSTPNDLGPYQYAAPMDLEPADGWNDNAEAAVWEAREHDKEEQRFVDSTVKAEQVKFEKWADSAVRAEKQADSVARAEK